MKARKGFLITLVLTIGVAAGFLLAPKPARSEFDLPALNQQVQHHDEVLDNHEARIQNVENDTKVIQQVTNVAPAPNPQPVPVVTPAPAPAPEPDQAPAQNYRTCLPDPC